MIWLGAYTVVRLLTFWRFPYCAEDAYITFRTARNWLWYGNPTFNPQESSWPASSPLWTTWMAAGLGIGANAEWWARLGSMTAEVFLILAVKKLVGKRGAIAFGILMVGFQPAIAISTSGIEMWAMVAAFAWALLGSRVALFLLVASRPEGIVLAVVALVVRRSVRRFAMVAAGLAVWVLFAWLTGQHAPAGLTAKIGTYGLHPFSGTYWLARMFWPFTSDLEQRTIAPIGIAALALLPLSRLNLRARVFAGTGAALLLAYWATGATYFFWYMALPIASAMLVIAEVCGRPSRWAMPLAVLIAASSWTTGYTMRRWDHQHRQLSRTSRALPDTGTVILDAIGVIGWQHPHARFIDVIGLCSPFAARIRATRKDGWYTDLIQYEGPTAFVAKKYEICHNLPDAGAGIPFTYGHGFGEITRFKPVADTSVSGIMCWGFKPNMVGNDAILLRALPITTK